jgi:lipopolysaccharide export system permease protein
MLALHRYMTRQIIVATVFTSAVLIALIAVIQSLRMVEFVVNRGLPSTVVFELLALRTPSFMTATLPIAFFVAILFVYNKLQGDSELVIMRSMGMSELKIARPAVTAAIVVMAAAYATSMYLLPTSFSSYKSREHEYRNAYGSVMLQAGKFNTPTETLTVYVRERVGAADLRGILIRDARDENHPLTILAERGLLTQDGDAPRVVLFNGNRQEVDPDTGRLTLLYFNQYAVTFDAEIPALQNRYRGPKERYIHELLWPGDSPSEIQHHDLLVAEGHRRLADPLNILALALLTLTFLLTGQHGRGSAATRNVSACAGAIAMQASTIGIMSVVSKSVLLYPLFYLAPCLVALASIAILWHGLRPKPSRKSMSHDPAIEAGLG